MAFHFAPLTPKYTFPDKTHTISISRVKDTPHRQLVKKNKKRDESHVYGDKLIETKAKQLKIRKR